MRKNRNLYEYLYQSLVSQFLHGAFLPGQKFPSQREICLQYNIGITTVRKVMRMLEKEGYLHTAQGRSAVVVYRASTETYMTFLVRRRDEIADAYNGLSHIMPSLYRESARRCKEAELHHLQKIVDGVLPEMTLDDLYEQVNAFFTTLLRTLNNQLVMDLELDSENYLHVPYLPLPGVKNPFALTPEKLKVWLERAMKQIRQKQFDSFHSSIKIFYRESAARVDAYLCALSQHVSAQVQTKSEIHWFRARERCELYVWLAMTIIRRIVSGEFDEQKYVSSISKLMEEYEVTKDTASRAVNLLNLLGFVRTIDKKGTVITLNRTPEKNGGLDLMEPIIQQRLSLFLDAFQILSLTAYDCATSFAAVPETLSSFFEDRLHTVQDGQLSPVCLQLLMNCFIQLLPYYSLKNIFQQLNEVILWGHYLQSVNRSFYPPPDHTAAAMMVVAAAMKGQESLDLAAAFASAFSQIYRDICTVISHLPDPGNGLLPSMPTG